MTKTPRQLKSAGTVIWVLYGRIWSILNSKKKKKTMELKDIWVEFYHSILSDFHACIVVETTCHTSQAVAFWTKKGWIASHRSVHHLQLRYDS